MKRILPEHFRPGDPSSTSPSLGELFISGLKGTRVTKPLFWRVEKEGKRRVFTTDQRRAANQNTMYPEKTRSCAGKREKRAAYSLTPPLHSTR